MEEKIDGKNYISKDRQFLKVLGAGFGRTGTMSLQKALNHLGYSCHHMESVLIDPTQQPEVFEKAYNHPEECVDWHQVYKGYDSAVDWPTTAFFDRLYALNPDAKVILTVRDVESWFNSISQTIYEWPDVDDSWPSQFLRTRRMARVIVRDGELNKSKDKLKAYFEGHINHVKRVVKPENLLVMEIGQGWDVLCSFLGKPKPNEPYPHCNRKENFRLLLQRTRAIAESNDPTKTSSFIYRIQDVYDQDTKCPSELN